VYPRRPLGPRNDDRVDVEGACQSDAALPGSRVGQTANHEIELVEGEGLEQLGLGRAHPLDLRAKLARDLRRERTLEPTAAAPCRQRRPGLILRDTDADRTATRPCERSTRIARSAPDDQQEQRRRDQRPKRLTERVSHEGR
jgi:hypothetical protein